MSHSTKYEEEVKQEKLNPSERSSGKEYFEADVKTEEAIPRSSTYDCDICGKGYKSKGNLNLHVLSTHRGINYPCGQCEYKANQKGTLRRHIQSVHEKIKYSCNLCYHQATTQGSLNRHFKFVHD